MGGTKGAVVKRIWYAMIDGRIDDRLLTHLGAWEGRLDARLSRMEEKIDDTRVELKRDIRRVEKNLDATRVELKRDVARVERNLDGTRVELKSQAHNVESRLSHQIERLGDRGPTAVPLDARVKQPD